MTIPTTRRQRPDFKLAAPSAVNKRWAVRSLPWHLGSRRGLIVDSNPQGKSAMNGGFLWEKIIYKLLDPQFKPYIPLIPVVELCGSLYGIFKYRMFNVMILA
jgi:hypothetical protein